MACGILDKQSALQKKNFSISYVLSSSPFFYSIPFQSDTMCHLALEYKISYALQNHFQFFPFLSNRVIIENSDDIFQPCPTKKRHSFAMSLCYLYEFTSIYQILHFLQRNIQFLRNRFRSFPTHESLKNLFSKFFTVLHSLLLSSQAPFANSF